MLYLSLVTFLGILLFSSVTNEIFNYKQILTVGEIVKEKTRNMEVFMYDVSHRRKNKNMPRETIETCIDSMEHFIRSSTSFFFENN